MKYKEIVSVTGLSDLYQLVSSKSDGAIVRTLDGDNTRFVTARSHNFTPLESIEVFTTDENVPLSDVFMAMQEAEDETPLADAKNKNEVATYFEKVFPSLDRDRVYASDMKKMLKWYPLLKEHDLLHFETEDEKETDETDDKED